MPARLQVGRHFIPFPGDKLNRSSGILPSIRTLLAITLTLFKANFKYVGGNEDFDVTSSHWGLAAGMEAEFPMSPKMSLLLSGGGE